MIAYLMRATDMLTKEILIGLLSFLISIPLAICDRNTALIPNRFTVPIAVGGILLGFVTGGLAGLESSLFGFVIGFIALLVPYLLGGMGAGDVKMLAALGAVVGYPSIVYLIIGMALAGGVMALAKLTFLPGFSLFLLRMKLVRFSDADNSLVLPYGVAISAGALVNLIYVLIAGS